NNPMILMNNTSYDLPNGVNIYLGDDSANFPLFGVGGGWSIDTRMIVRGIWYGGTSCVGFHIVSHEMGHILSLYHTHHGTFDEGSSDPNECVECADGTNGSICGDYVKDTPADPNMQWNVKHFNVSMERVGIQCL